MQISTAREQTLIMNEYIRIQLQQQDIWTHVMENKMVSSFVDQKYCSQVIAPIKTLNNSYMNAPRSIRIL